MTISLEGNICPCCSIFAGLKGFPAIANVHDSFAEVVDLFLSDENKNEYKMIDMITSGFNNIARKGVDQKYVDKLEQTYYDNLEYLLKKFKSNYSELNIEISFSEGINLNNRIGKLLNFLVKNDYYKFAVRISVPINILYGEDKEKLKKFKEMKLNTFKSLYKNAIEKNGKTGPELSDDVISFYAFFNEEDIEKYNLNSECYESVSVNADGNIYPCCSAFSVLKSMPHIAKITDSLSDVEMAFTLYHILRQRYMEEHNIDKWTCRVCTSDEFKKLLTERLSSFWNINIKSPLE